jgi:hypothetical protein
MSTPDKAIESFSVVQQSTLTKTPRSQGLAAPLKRVGGRALGLRGWQGVFVLWAILAVSTAVQQMVILQRLDIVQIITNQCTAEINRRVEAGDTSATVVPADLIKRQNQARLQQKWGWAPNLIILPLGYLIIGTIYFGLMRLLGASGSFVDYQWGTAMSYLPAVLLMNGWTTIKAAAANSLTKAGAEKLAHPFVAKVFFPAKLSPFSEALLDSITLFNVLLIVLGIYYLRRIGKTNTSRAAVAVAVFWIGYVGIKLIIVGMLVPQTCESCAAIE